MIWGPWATAMWGLAIAMVFFVIGLLLAVGFIAFQTVGDPNPDLEALARSTANNGDLVTLSVLVTAVVCVPLILLVIVLRRGASVRLYLTLEPVSFSVLVKWLVAALIFVLASDSLTLWLDREIVPEFMAQVYATAGNKVLLWVAFVVAAPLFEETFFRGFLFHGFLRSRLGPIGAVSITALTWTSFHLQYGAYELLTLTFLGFLLGVARLRANSIYPAIIMHSFINTLAALEAELTVG